MRMIHETRRSTSVLLFAACATAALSAACSVAHADDKAAIAAALAEPEMPATQVLDDVRAFITARIVKPPRPTDRSAWQREAERLRRAMLDKIVFRGEAQAWRDAKCKVEWLDTIEGGPGYSIRKFRYEALPDMWIPGLLYLPEKLEGKVPVAINVNGHSADGKATDYKQLRAINLAKRGMLSLNLEWFGMGQLRTSGFAHGRMNQLDLCGASGLAPFYLALVRGIDLGLSLDHADPDRVLVAGLSGGGWQTILISSLDERVRLANPVAGYGSFFTNIAFDDMGDSEQAPADMATVADYAHLTAMRAPRPTLLTYNASDDCCFKSGHTLEPLLAAARPTFALFGAQDQLRSHVNHDPGTHNFEQENREQLYAAIGDYFYPNDTSFARDEIDSTAEVKTAEQLHVPLPDDNADFHRLAESLAVSLPGDSDLPTHQPEATKWQTDGRKRLAALLRVGDYRAQPADRKEISAGEGQTAVARRFRLDDEWLVPVTEIVARGKDTTGVALLVADEGRASRADHVERLVAGGYRVLALDPLFVGASQIQSQDPQYTYPLLISSVGQRALGIQAAQILALARWAKHQYPDQPVMIAATGPRTCMAALVATALAPSLVDSAELDGALASLKLLVERDEPVENLPELFAFGLLAEFDVRQLVALAAPRAVIFQNADEPARRELHGLVGWYALFDADFDPVR